MAKTCLTEPYLSVIINTKSDKSTRNLITFECEVTI